MHVDLPSTPAYAGLTWVVLSGFRRFALYPRMHGTDAMAAFIGRRIRPLPPHTRG